MTIDVNKKYKTRDGKEVQIFTTEGHEPYPVLGYVFRSDCWCPGQWTKHGNWKQCLSESASDLVEVPKPTYRPYTPDEFHELRGLWIRHANGTASQIIAYDEYQVYNHFGPIEPEVLMKRCTISGTHTPIAKRNA